jgi:hypothetical protein
LRFAPTIDSPNLEDRTHAYCSPAFA